MRLWFLIFAYFSHFDYNGYGNEFSLTFEHRLIWALCLFCDCGSLRIGVDLIERHRNANMWQHFKSNSKNQYPCIRGISKNVEQNSNLLECCLHLFSNISIWILQLIRAIQIIQKHGFIGFIGFHVNEQ